MPHKAILYTRQGCCLCDQAKSVLQSSDVEIEEVDIDSDAGLRERYGECVPVVVLDGKERFRGRVDPRLLKRLLGERDR